jgi:hypothetical protein
VSLENLLPSFSDLGSLSIVILLSAASLYYFGKLILDVKVEQQEQVSNYYVTGLMFALGYIVLPFLVVWAVSGYLNFYLPIFPNVILQLIVLIVLAYGLILNIGRFTLFSRFQDAYKIQLGLEKEKSNLVKFADQRMGESLVPKSISLQEKIANKITNQYAIFAMSIIIGWVVLATSKGSNLISPESILIYIMTFFNLTLLAITFGYIGVYHPPATIFLENGQKVSGRIVKIGKFVNFINEAEGKKYFVNSSKIMYVEESMFKEKYDELLRLTKVPQPKQKETEKTASQGMSTDKQ